MSQPADEPSEFEHKTFLEHLHDLRNTVVRSLIALVAAMIVSVPLAPHVLRLLKRPLVGALEGTARNSDEFLQVFTVVGGFNLSMLIIVLTGLVISAPLIVFFIAGFVFPGLKQKEQRAVKRFAAAAVILFAAGVCMGYFLMLPVAIKVLLGMGEWIGVYTGFYSANDYVTFCLYLLLAFGLSFELPVVILLLGYMGIVNSRQLRSVRGYAVVGILVIAMVVTPTTDIPDMMMMAVPMMLMYEISIWLVWFRERRKVRET